MRSIPRQVWLTSIGLFFLGGSLLSIERAVAHELASNDDFLALSTLGSSTEIPPTTFEGYAFNDYILGPGDELSIAVIGYPEFDNTYRIVPDGSISVPLIGTIQAGGQTLGGLSQRIQEELGRKYLVNPVVDLNLLRLRPISITISGEVHRPGPLQLNSLQDNGSNPTLVTALLEAGGVTQFADIREVVVKRQQPNGLNNTMMFNFWDSLVSEPTAINLVLRDGDSVIIPRLPPGDTLDRSLVARSTVSPSTIQVKVVGEVTRPGEISVSPASSLSSAIATAGGPTEDAKLSEVTFIRVENEDEVISTVLDLRTLTDTTQVQDGDVIIVPKTGVSTGLDFLGRLANPFRVFTDIFQIFD
ncbi:MAG: polysaccharide biosynthesis/export family protein [Chlamydiota bacterium]